MLATVTNNATETTAARTIRRTVGGQIDNEGLRFLYDAGMFVGDMALSYALGKMAFYEAGAVAPLTQEELQLAEYANDVASMASEYGEISITAGGELVIDPVAETFLTGYTSNITPEEYQIAFDFFRGEGNACERRRGRIQRARVGAAVGDGQAACPPQTEPGTARGIAGMSFEQAAET